MTWRSEHSAVPRFVFAKSAIRCRFVDRFAGFRAPSRVSGQRFSAYVLCAGFWTPASGGAPLAPAAGVQKAPRHEVAGSLGPGGQPALWGFDFRVDYDGGREAGARRPG